MKTTLNIRWDGTTPGLSEHALSLETWLKPLGLLLSAVRRTASSMATDALADTERGARGGRLAKAAANIDLRLTSLSDGCVNLGFDCALRELPVQQDLFTDELPGRALNSVLDAIEAEAKGELRSAAVRKFLESMPTGLTIQEYELVTPNGRRKVTVTEAKLPSPGPQLPTLAVLVGQVIGVGFEPGRWTVTIRTSEGAQSFSATEQQVEVALANRAGDVRVTAVLGKPQRLIALRNVDEVSRAWSAVQRDAHFVQSWQHTLEILSR